VRRLTLAVCLAAAWLVITAPAALADPPGPTTYQSEVVEIEPAASGFAVEIIGGDSFVLLTADAGVTVEIVGYNGEPYLRFLPDGSVEENAASPSKYVNEERFGRVALPDDVDATAAPDWEVVAANGSFAWHDHRTHWMNPVAPPGRGPGDQVAEGVVPMLVDGVGVDVTVVSIWQPAPPPLPAMSGLLFGAGLGFAAIRRRPLASLVALGLAAAALVVGAVAFLSVPAETVPPWSLYVFPLVSFLIALAVAYPKWLGRFGDTVRRQRTLLLLLVAFELVAWGILHWDWLWLAILPTNLPFWLDRFVAATVLVGSGGVAVAALLDAGSKARVAR
jgi:hypothetical protein